MGDTDSEVTSLLSISTQEVPNHRSFVVLFKYFGGGEVDFVQHLPSTPEKLTVEGEASSLPL